MKTAFYFAVREMRRRPRRMLSLVLVTVAILTALNMLLFYLEADWRQQVMPESPTSYHFRVRCVDDFDTVRDFIKEQPWVQAWYEEDIYDYYDEEYRYTEFRVRVTWEHVVDFGFLAREMFDGLSLWDSSYYYSIYEQNYKISLSKLKASLNGGSHLNGVPLEQAAHDFTKTQMITNARNNRFCNLTVNSYIIRPEFAMYMSLFSLFLGSTTVILFSEQYRNDMREFGSLRALGLKKWQLIAINCVENLAVSLVSIPIATAVTALIVRVYTAATSHLDDGTVYLNMSEYLPVGAMLIVAFMLTLVSLVGCFAVCMFYRDRTVMDMLRGIESQRVSFVSKTSPRFDTAVSLGIYDRLYIFRSRISIALGAVVIALMMPLPLWYLALIVKMIGAELEGGYVLVGIYHTVQAALLFITSAVVTFVSIRAAVGSRSRELAVLRALGTAKKRLRRSAFAVPFMQVAVVTVLAALLYMKLSDPTMTVSSLPKPKVDFGVQAAQFLASALGTALLAIPPMLFGVLAALRRFFKKSTIENLRETE